MTQSDSACIQAEGRTLHWLKAADPQIRLLTSSILCLTEMRRPCDEADLAGSEFGVPSMKAGDTEEGPQYQDPRQLEGPSAPPVAVGAASPAVAIDAPAQPGASTAPHLGKPSQTPDLQAEATTNASTLSEVGTT